MAVPKQRHTKSRRDKRRMHLFLKRQVLVECPRCGALVLPHTLCENCGYYREKEMVDVLKKLDKKERKKREKEIESKKTPSSTDRSESQKPQKRRPLTMEELSKK